MVTQATAIPLEVFDAVVVVPTVEFLYRSWSPTVHRWASRLAGPGLDADDVVQQVFIQVQRHVSQLKDPERTRAWLFRVTQNEVRMARRRDKWRRFWTRNERQDSEDGEAPEAGAPAVDIERLHATQTVYTVLDRLSEKDRSLIVLFELEGASGSELALMLGITEAALWVRLHRARARFLACLAEVEGANR